MQQNGEEEDELALLNYKSPKGQLIKLLEQKIKKPEIDDTLGKVLDKFSQLTNEQTAFLDNGIFYMNFAEDALLLQSCGQYYGKRVDKLWDELLQFHTRMVKYDETTAKHCTDSNKREARKKEIAKLEERLNRGKRKKIVLADPENDAPPVNGLYLTEVDRECMSELFNRDSLLPEEGVEIPEEPVVPFEDDPEILDQWRKIRYIEQEEKRRNNYSVLVMEYHRLKYRMKHYIIPTSKAMVYDMDDPEEFNTREGRLISFHHIKHLFDDNDRCLIPDEDFTIARLRIAFVLKKKWLMQNKIDPKAPYETYKEAWEKYEREFFANEKRKIQNMPQRNSEELMLFYKALAKKEQIARQKVEKLREMGVKDLPVICFENVIVAPVKEGYDGIFDPYIPEGFDAPTPVIDITEENLPHPSEGDHEAELSTLLGDDFPKLADPSSQTQSRSDSGYFDGGFEADDESDHEGRSESVVAGSDTPFEFDKENAENKDETTENPPDNTTDPENITPEAVAIPALSDQNVVDNIHAEPMITSLDSLEGASVTLENRLEPEITNQQSEVDENLDEIDRDDMDNAIKKFVTQAAPDDDLVYVVLENSYFTQTEDMITIIYDKPEMFDSDDESIHGDQIMYFGQFYKQELLARKQALQKRESDVETKDKTKVQESNKRKLELSSRDDLPPKRRKLSQKQIDKLKRSLVLPQKEQKWEHFFSLNYQAETGEGEITRVEYESDVEDEDLLDNMERTDDNLNEGEDQNNLNISGYHSDHDESHLSDNGCRPESTPLPLTQDSGVNMSIGLTENQEPQVQSEPTEVQQDKPAEIGNSENRIDFANLDAVADFCKAAGMPNEELEKEQHPIEQRELTPREKEREDIRGRVNEWREYIMPKLKKLDEHDFDIHEYGSNIMNSVKTDEPTPFSELVNGKSSAEVVRYFISSLQLANTLNVEICGAKRGELSNDTFQLKLLNKERYHEHLQDYQAPSEETLGEKLKKIKEIRMQNKEEKKKHVKRMSEEDDYEPQNTPSSRHSSRNNPSSSRTARSQKKIKILNYSIVRPSNQESIQQPSTSRLDSSPTRISRSSKKITILNYNMAGSINQEYTQRPSTSTAYPDFDFQQPSTSRQADIIDHQNAFESAVSHIAQTPTRTSIDSGFIPSCDEDFLEQFDQLQQTSDTHLRSTPIKPRKDLKITLVRHKSSN